MRKAAAITVLNPVATPSLASIGIDICKDAFHLVGFDQCGQIALRRKIRRLGLIKAFDQLPRAVSLAGAVHTPIQVTLGNMFPGAIV